MIMEKKIFNFLPLALVYCCFLSFFYSCTGTVDESYTNVIPADATMVASVNVKGLMEKAGYKDFQPVSTAIGSMYPAETLSLMPDVMETILADPGKSGIDFDAPVYVFLQPDGASAGIVMKVDDKEKVEAWVETVVGAPGSASVTFAYLDENSICVYEKNGSSVWQQPATPEAQFNQSASFKKMKEMKGDLHYYCNTRELMKKYSARAVSKLPPIYTETAIVGTCSFENGSASITAALVANTPEAEAGIAAFKKALCPSEGKFVGYLPESTTLLASVCGKGTDYLDYVNNTPYMGFLFGNYRFWEPMIKALDGEAVIALTGLSDYSFSFIAYADLAPEVTEAQMKEILSRNSLDKAYWGIKDHCLYVTNDKALSENAFKEASPSLRRAEYGKQPDGKPIYILMDIAKIMANPALEQAVSQMGNNGPLQFYSLLSAMEYELNGDYELVMRVGLKDKKENVLKMVTDLLTK